MALAASLAAAQPPLFDPEPALTLENYSWSVCGDVDADGRNDLLVFSRGQIRLHLNTGDPSLYAASPTWSVTPTGIGGPGVFGDVDADGDLDLAFAESPPNAAFPYLGPLYVLRNEGGDLGRLQEAQILGPWVHRRSLVLADLDEDGDLDLVSGNTEPDPDDIHLYDSEAGAYGATPAWTSATRYSASQVMAADLDGDGDVDLLFGNQPTHGEPEPMTIFLNRFDEGAPAIFASEPDLEIFPNSSSSPLLRLCSGDVDGDGDPDLVKGQDYVGSVHLNRLHPEGLATIFEEAPAWTQLPQWEVVRSLVLGDVDGDGNLDLVASTWQLGRVFLNDGTPGLFGDTPDWSFEDSDQLGLFDADGDGDLDLAYRRGLYRNLSPRLEPVPRATLVPAAATRAVALADVNRDGHNDLICGNDGTTRLHLCLPTVFGSAFFSPATSWSPPFGTYQTQALAVGDVDGDEIADLVLGNRQQESLLFLGTGTSFGGTAAWSSPDASRYTTSLALGDVDGDGDPDLVLGNLDQPAQLYLNEGGDFGVEVRWSSAASASTRAVALGDVDGDGRPDLICGIDGGRTVMYRNLGDTFTREPAWRASEARRTQAVALGDVDGDGLLDLACGNLGQRNALYINRAGGLIEFATWQSAESDSTLSLAWADVDADGWLDLVCGGPGGATCWYQNLGGTLAETATWRAEEARPTTAVALADLERDGDLDLVCGNDGQAPTVHAGRRNPLYLHDLTNPTHQTGNLPIAIRDVAVTNPDRNLYRIAFTVADAESDPAWLVLRYRYADGSGYEPLFGGAVQGPFAAPPAGQRHELDWDVTLLTFRQRPLVLELVSVEMPRAVSEIRQRTCYQHALGTVEVRRSEVSADTLVTFPAVTLGDTVTASIRLRSAGNEPLQVSGIALPSTEMWLDGPAAFTVAAGETAWVMVHLAPRQSLQAGEAIVIESDAPLSRRLEIPVAAEILPLSVTTRALLEGDAAPLGEALTVQTIRRTRVESCTLLYRAAGAQQFVARPMERFEDSFQAVIPGQDVTERGLEYYVLLENSGVTATDPAGAPADSLYTVAVTAPAGVVATPQPTLGADYVDARPIPVLVSLPEGSLFAEGWLYYRRGGEAAWDSTAVVEAVPLPVAVIPDSVVGPRGVQYWVRVRTTTSDLTDPAVSPRSAPRSLQVKVSDFTEPSARPAGAYLMASVPLDFGPEFAGTFETVLGTRAAYGAYDPTRWRCFRWLAAESRYLELGGDPSPALSLEPGRAFWLVSREDGRVGTAPLPGWSVPTGGPFEIVLEPGWNQVANPFAFPVTWAGVLVEGGPWVDGAISPPYLLTPGGYVWGADLLLEPFSGFWVHNDGEGPVTVGIPPVEAAAAEKSGHPERLAWSLEVTASCAGLRDGGARAGVATAAREGRDGLDRPRPPAHPGRALSVTFVPAESGPRAGALLQDVRDVSAAGWTWALDVGKSFADEGLADEVVLRVDGAASLPSGLEARLLDLELGRSQDLRQQAELGFRCGISPAAVDPASARFRLVVGTADYVRDQVQHLDLPPAATALHAPRPNPFNPAVLLRFDLAATQRARLRIYDASGRLVRTLRDGPHDAGGHEAVWRGEDDHGRRAAAGVYFARLETARDGVKTRKLTMVR